MFKAWNIADSLLTSTTEGHQFWEPTLISATTPSYNENDISTGRAGVSATIRRGGKGFTCTAGFKSLPFLAGGCRLHLGGYCK